MMNKFKEFFGLCSYLNAEHSITVKCADVSSSTTRGWKPISFECDHEGQCPDTKNCPVAAKLPEVFLS